MTVEIAWAALAVVTVASELAARRAKGQLSTLGRLGAWIGRSLPGRALLWVAWVFVGVHLFTRYTLAR